jgi:hypothetical protein
MGGELTNDGSLKLEFYRLCTVCGAEVNAAEKRIFYKLWNAHTESAEHQNALEEKMRAKRAAKAKKMRPEATSDKASFPFYRMCRDCGGEVAAREEPTFFNNWSQHLVGQRHRSALTAKATTQSKLKRVASIDIKKSHDELEATRTSMLSMTCRLCNHEVRGPTKAVLDNNFKQHVKGTMHQRLLYEREEKKQKGEPVSIENDFDALSVEDIDLSSSSSSDNATTNEDSAQAEAEQDTRAEEPISADRPSETFYDYFYDRFSDARRLETVLERHPTLVTTQERNMRIDNAYIGREMMPSAPGTAPRDIYLNVSEPFSAVVCGLQNSGMSHTLAVLIESCLAPCPEPSNAPIVHLKYPMTALAFVANAKNTDLKHIGTHSPSIKTLLNYKRQFGRVKVVIGCTRETRFEAMRSFYEKIGCECVLLIDSLKYAQGTDDAFTKIFDGVHDMGTLIVVDTLEWGNDTELVDRHLKNVLDSFLFLKNDSSSKPVRKLLILDDAEQYLSFEKTKTFCELVVVAMRYMNSEDLRVVISTRSPMCIPEELLEELSLCVLHRFQSERWYDRIRRCFLNSAAQQLPPGVFKSLECGDAVLFAKRGLQNAAQAFPIRIRRRITGCARE